MSKKAVQNEARSPCPLACSLDILGDRWTLLVLRDLLAGKKRYGELANSPEGIPTNILAERLKRLEEAGLIAAAAYQDRPTRYEYAVTKKGKDLLPTMKSLAEWGLKHIPHTEIRVKIAA
jgi:DNA-binding HxlR family transcriptional regulator